MPSVDKASVREEVARLKADFQSLRDKGKVSPEVQILMNSLFMIVALMLSIFLERKTRKTDKHSSIPPSQSDKDDTALGTAGANGKGKCFTSTMAGNTRTRRTVNVATVETCERCGEDLSHNACQGHERRTKIDILFEKVIEHTDAEIKQCPSCGTRQKGRFPADLHGPLQYGNGVKAFVINLMIGQMVTLKRVQRLLQSMIGELLSEASLLKFVLRLYQALAPGSCRLKSNC